MTVRLSLGAVAALAAATALTGALAGCTGGGTDAGRPAARSATPTASSSLPSSSLPSTAAAAPSDAASAGSTASARRPSGAATPGSVPSAPATSDAAGDARSRSCSALLAATQRIRTDLRSELTGAASDPRQAASLLAKEVATYRATIATLPDPAVRAAGEKAATSYQAVAQDAGALASDPSSAPSRLSSDLDAVDSAFTQIGRLCG